MRAYTLVELLAVVALLALGVTMLTPMLVGAGASSRLDSAAIGIINLDARARLIAQGHGGARLEMDGDGGIALEEGPVDPSRPAPADNPKPTWLAPTGLGVSIRSDTGERIGTIVYDAAGRSRDYEVILDEPPARRVIRIAGLTGWTTTETANVLGGHGR